MSSLRNERELGGEREGRGGGADDQKKLNTGKPK